MPSPHRLVAFTLLLLTGLASLGAKLPLDPEGAALSWTPAQTLGRARAKGVGAFKLEGTAIVNLAFGPGQTWSADYIDNDGFLPLSGEWSRKSEASRRLKLTLDEDTVANLAASYAIELEVALLNQLGIPLDIEFALTKARLTVVLKPHVKQGTVDARLVGVFRFEGSSTGYGVVDSPSKASLRVRGTSQEVALTDLLGDV